MFISIISVKNSHCNLNQLVKKSSLHERIAWRVYNSNKILFLFGPIICLITPTKIFGNFIVVSDFLFRVTKRTKLILETYSILCRKLGLVWLFSWSFSSPFPSMFILYVLIISCKYLKLLVVHIGNFSRTKF